VKCPDCGGKLIAYRTYHPTVTHTRHYRECDACGVRFKSEEHLGDRLDGHRVNALDALTGSQVRPDKAAELVKKHPRRRLKAYCENLPAIKADYERQTGKAVRDDAGFLVWAIETGWPLPNPSAGESHFPVDLPVYEPAPPPALSDDEKLWQEAKIRLQRQMTRATFDARLDKTRTIPRKNGKLLVEVETEEDKEWIENRLLKIIQRTLEGIEVEFVCSHIP
jgi:ssDNA-binding Zn-finger/Zn-ribbon topoisomerase 1